MRGTTREHKDIEDDAPRGTDERARTTSLDLSTDEMRELASATIEMVTGYFEDVAELPIFPQTSAGELAALFRLPVPVEPDAPERVLDDCRAIINSSRHNGHPRFFGYVASPAAPVGAFANFVASALNQNVVAWRSAPAATEVERTVVRWLGSLVGYGEDAGGLLTSGGSMANLNALFIAHRAKSGHELSARGLWNAGAPATIYLSDQCHLSLAKAADVLGIGREQVRVVKSDEQFRLDVRDLRERLASDANQGVRPFCVVASAGTVNTGAVDPLAEVARVAEEHGLWFHIDGAYGALAALDASKRMLFDGIERADSLSLDPHKWLYSPLDCGCLLLREPAAARAAFNSTEADYIKVFEDEPDESFAFWDYGVELSRPFRAFKVWMMLRYYGARRIASAIAEDNALAAYLAERVGAADDFELLAPVTLGICCFRYVPPRFARDLQAARHDDGGGGGGGGDDDQRAALNTQLNELNARIMHVVQRGGRAYLSNAVLRGRFALRASITNFRTTRRDIDAMLDIVRDAAKEIDLFAH